MYGRNLRAYQKTTVNAEISVADPYYVLGDFDDYRRSRQLAHDSYRDSIKWAQMCWINICRSGTFSSDRTISDYARDIWQITDNKLEN